MSKLDALYRLHHALDGRRTGISRHELMQMLDVSAATLGRYISDLRDKFEAPLIFDAERGGYRYDTSDSRHHLPGLWFNDHELAAIVTINSVLKSLAPGLLERVIRPIEERFQRILSRNGLRGQDIDRRVRLRQAASRTRNDAIFQTVAAATLNRQRLAIDYFVRERGQTTERTISPQRLIHYRDNWYLEAWCDQRKALRVFSVDCIRQAVVQPDAAIDISDTELDQRLGSAYGIFAGPPVATAVLVFSAERARWVANEIWHPDQHSRRLEDGRHELRVPYSDPRELLMDILRHGSEVEVIAPVSLRKAVSNTLQQAAARYHPGTA